VDGNPVHPCLTTSKTHYSAAAAGAGGQQWLDLVPIEQAARRAENRTGDAAHRARQTLHHGAWTVSGADRAGAEPGKHNEAMAITAAESIVTSARMAGLWEHSVLRGPGTQPPRAC
jgi:hypothetical protein